jgi:hypothetical protein
MTRPKSDVRYVRFRIPKEHTASRSTPPIERRPPKQFPRAAPNRTDGRQKHACVEKESHGPPRKRRMSDSSSAIQAPICSGENRRGSGSDPSARNREARNSSNSCFCSIESVSAAASISASVVISILYPNCVEDENIRRIRPRVRLNRINSASSAASCPSTQSEAKPRRISRQSCLAAERPHKKRSLSRKLICSATAASTALRYCR